MCYICASKQSERVNRCMSCLKKMNERLKLWCAVESTRPINYGRGALKYDNDYKNSIASWIEVTITIFDTEISCPIQPNRIVSWDVINKIMKKI